MLIEFKKQNNTRHKSMLHNDYEQMVDISQPFGYKYNKHSAFIDQVLEHDMKLKNEQREKFEQLKQKKYKQNAYNRFVKEMHPIQISPRKEIELISNIQRLKHPVKEKKNKYDDYLTEQRRQPSYENYLGGIVDNRQRRLRLRNDHSGESLTPKQMRSPHQDMASVRQQQQKRINYLPETLEKIKASKKNLVSGSRLNNQSDWMDQLKKRDLSQ